MESADRSAWCPESSPTMLTKAREYAEEHGGVDSFLHPVHGRLVVSQQFPVTP